MTLAEVLHGFSAAELLRWIVMFGCVFNIGVLVALFDMVGRFVVPPIPMRLLFLANGLMLVTLGFSSYERLHDQLTFRTPLFAVALALELVGLVMLRRWYRTDEGREHVRRMTL